MSTIALTLPVFNEEDVLENSTRILHNFLSKNCNDDWKIIIVNNGSTDRTKNIADRLKREFARVEAMHLSIKGRGHALRSSWTENTADVNAYCDIDLASDIGHLPELFSAIKNGYAIAIGSRYIKGANAARSIKRLVMSKVYIGLVKFFFPKTKLSDYQCGFKAVSRAVIEKIVGDIADQEWFFDSELLLRAEHAGLAVVEIPVRWQESKTTKVKFAGIIYDYIKKIILLKKRLSS